MPYAQSDMRRPRAAPCLSISYPLPARTTTRPGGARVKPTLEQCHPGLVPCRAIDMDEAWSRFGLRSTQQVCFNRIENPLPPLAVTREPRSTQQRRVASQPHMRPPQKAPPLSLPPPPPQPSAKLLRQGATRSIAHNVIANRRLSRAATGGIERQDSFRSASSYGSDSSWCSIPVPYRQSLRRSQATATSFRQAEWSDSLKRDSFASDTDSTLSSSRPCSTDSRESALWNSLEMTLGAKLSSPPRKRPQYGDLGMRTELPYFGPPSSILDAPLGTATPPPSRIPRPKQYTSNVPRPRLPQQERSVSHAVVSPASWTGPTAQLIDRLHAAGRAARQRRIHSEQYSGRYL